MANISTKHWNNSSNTYRELLESVLVLMLRGGADADQLADEFKRGLVRANTARGLRRFNSRPQTIIEGIASMLFHWANSSEFVGGDGTPVALSVNGRRRSIARLALYSRVNVSSEMLIVQLRKMKLVRKISPRRYLPTNDEAAIEYSHDQVTEFLAASVRRLIQTGLYNATRAHRARRLIQKDVVAFDLPRSKVGAFRKFGHEQGRELARATNAWLEENRLDARTSRANPDSRVAVGLHIFAHIG